MDNGLKFQSKPFNLHYFLAAGLLFTGKAHAVDWPEFQGGSAQGHATKGTKLPLEWSTQKNVAWKQALPGEGWSTPIIWKGRLYLTAAVAKDEGLKADRELRALCLEASSGRVVWDKSVFSQDGASAPRIHKRTATPAQLLLSPLMVSCMFISGIRELPVSILKVTYSGAIVLSIIRQFMVTVARLWWSVISSSLVVMVRETPS